MESAQIVENYAIVTLGVIEKPIPSILHLQKEIFLLSQMKKELQLDFNFEKHYKGPYSQVLTNIIEDPVYVNDAFSIHNGSISLSNSGSEFYNKLVENNKSNRSFVNTTLAIKFIRSLYDDLSEDELLFLIYDSYPSYTEFSSVSDKIMKNKISSLRIINSLLNKKAITNARYLELKEKYGR